MDGTPQRTDNNAGLLSGILRAAINDPKSKTPYIKALVTEGLKLGVNMQQIYDEIVASKSGQKFPAFAELMAGDGMGKKPA